MRPAFLRGLHHGLIASGALTLLSGVWLAADYMYRRRKDHRG